MTSDCGVDTRPVMVTGPDQLVPAMLPMAERFPDIHERVVGALGRAMCRDGVMEFTVTGLAKDSEVRLGLVRDYLKQARGQRLLHLLGRRTDNGKIRYCAYHVLVRDPGGSR